MLEQDCLLEEGSSPDHMWLWKVLGDFNKLGCSSDTEVFSDQGIPSFSNPFELLQV